MWCLRLLQTWQQTVGVPQQLTCVPAWLAVKAKTLLQHHGQGLSTTAERANAQGFAAAWKCCCRVQAASIARRAQRRPLLLALALALTPTLALLL